MNIRYLHLHCSNVKFACLDVKEPVWLAACVHKDLPIVAARTLSAGHRMEQRPGDRVTVWNAGAIPIGPRCPDRCTDLVRRPPIRGVGTA